MNKRMMHTIAAACLTGALLIAQPLFAEGSYRVITSNENLTIADRVFGSAEIVVTGHLPEFKVSDPLFAQQVNDKVNVFYDEALVKAGEMEEENLVVIFSYDVFGNSRYMSVALHAMTISGNNRFEELSTFVLDKNENKLLNLQDILGAEAFAIADKVIGDAIEANPGQYFNGENGFEGFKGVSEKTKFYVDGSDITILFDKYEIAPGYMGRPSFVIPLPAEAEEQQAADGEGAASQESAAAEEAAAADEAEEMSEADAADKASAASVADQADESDAADETNAKDETLQEQKSDEELFPLG